MILHLNEKINRYYVQTLCMVFFPGIRFGENEEPGPDTPELTVQLTDEAGGVRASAQMSFKGESVSCEGTRLFDEKESRDKSIKMAVGAAVIGAGSALFNYRPSWGMLTGVRPSKLATEMFQDGFSKSRIKKTLTGEYLLLPKKAQLAIDVSLNEAALIGSPRLSDCSVYVSIPFCPTRCAYCSFVSYTSRKLLNLIPEYLDKLCSEIRFKFDLIRQLGLSVRTIYIGGGTPTILNESQLARLLSTIAECWDVRGLEEFTLESGRPDTIDGEKLAVAGSFGVNRISVNPQTMNDDILQGIGRKHSVEDFLRAYEVARNSGIPIINTDLIAGLPGDKFRTFSKSFDRIMALRPENITVHTLSLKNASELVARGPEVYSMRGGDTGKCIDYSQITCQHEGYVPYYMYRQKNTVGNYENVGYALPGTEGRYNIYMMEETHTILAAGAGAVSKLVDYKPADGGKPVIERLFNSKYPYEYLAEDKFEAQKREIESFYERRRQSLPSGQEPE